MDRSLSNAARRRFEKLENNAPLPEWFPALAMVLLLCLGIYTVVQLMVTKTPTSSVTTTTLLPSSTTLASPVTTTTSVTSTTAPATVAVENASANGSLNVPLGAVTLTKRIALAEVTGVAAGIPVATGSSPVPQAAVAYVGAAIQSVLVNNATPNEYSFLVSVLTGSSGQVGTYSITVINDHGWKYTSALS